VNDRDKKLIAEQYAEVLNEQEQQPQAPPVPPAPKKPVNPNVATAPGGIPTRPSNVPANYKYDTRAAKGEFPWYNPDTGMSPKGMDQQAFRLKHPSLANPTWGQRGQDLLTRGGQLLGQAGQGMSNWYSKLSPGLQGALGLGGIALAAKTAWDTIKDSAKREGKVLTEDETMEQVVAKLNLMTEDEMNAFAKELGDDADIDHDFNIGDTVRLSDSIGGGLGEITEISEDGEGSFAVVELMQDQPDAESEASTAERGDNMSVHMSDLEPAHDDNVFEDSFDVAANNLYMKYVYNR